MRRASQHLEFDLTLAKQTSAENPVYYVQYSHARICSIARFAREKGFDPAVRPTDWTFRVPAERRLALMLMRYPDTVSGAARSREPHRVVYYALELAREFHAFYEQTRVVSDDRAATEFRVYLCQCASAVMRSALDLVGVGAPERM
jgi:arginyl-tRNA synthetase